MQQTDADRIEQLKDRLLISTLTTAEVDQIERKIRILEAQRS